MWRFDAALAQELSMQLIIQEALPFDFFSRPRVIAFIKKALQPNYCAVSRTTLKRKAMQKWKTIYQDLKDFFTRFNGRVSVTTDIWTAPHTTHYSFICVTIHWVDPKTWLMQKRIIAFENFPHPHGGEQIYDILMRVFNGFGIKEKILSITLDNASNNTNALGRLKRVLNPLCEGDFLHVRCCCHIFNLAVQKGLASMETCLAKFKRLNVAIFKSGPVAFEKYEKFCKSKRRRCLRPLLDMAVRWNSTYIMIGRLLKNKDLLSEYHLEHLSHLNEVITETEWTILSELHTGLGVLYQATMMLSQTYFPTSHAALISVSENLKTLTAFGSLDETWDAITTEMFNSLIKYFNDFPPIFLIASALNPLVNFKGVTTSLSDIGKALGQNESEINENIAKFEKSVKQLFNVYDNECAPRGEGASTPMSSSSQASATRPNNPFTIGTSWFQNMSASKRTRVQSSLDELSIYKETDYTHNVTPEEFAQFDVLKWWQERERIGQFKILTTMARDVLTVQASSVASECCFSLSGRILSARRCMLKAESVQMAVMLKDYYDSMERCQNDADLEEGLNHLEEAILEDDYNRDFTSGTSNNNTEPENEEGEHGEDFEDAQDRLNAGSSSNVNSNEVVQYGAYTDDGYNYWNFNNSEFHFP